MRTRQVEKWVKTGEVEVMCQGKTNAEWGDGVAGYCVGGWD